MWKNTVEPDSPQMTNMEHAHFMLDTCRYTHTHTHTHTHTQNRQ